MTTLYIERLEQIIGDMQAALPKSDYLPWLYFLREVHPESVLLKTDDDVPQARELTEEIAQETVKECNDIREVMLLAEQNQYPTWFIQPNFREGIESRAMEQIPFPTDRIPTISSHALEELFKKYLSTLEEQGVHVDGVLISGDKPLLGTNGETTYSRILFRPRGMMSETSTN